ncbi:alcohol oxidase [Mycena sp. CBHHK59/15]|nr:alcohol oxidase [Mycena sp. CBHHK59/15]
MILPVSQVDGKMFDYVVIGENTSMNRLAGRILTDLSVSVLVVEAGPENLNDPNILTPATFRMHFGNEQYDWGFKTLPQRNCEGRSVVFNRGKGLGGTSAINFFQYHRPSKPDVDAFEKLGNLGWNWDLLEQYYDRSEHFIEPKVKEDAMNYDVAQHGTEGPLTVSYPAVMSNFELPYQNALQHLGINTVNEPFSGDTKGTWLTPVTIDPRDRIRSYSANKYYQPNAERENLTVVTSSHVTKVIHEKDSQGNATATGVAFVHAGKTHSVQVRKEVIISAGTIMSSQILELSGIGDKDVLRKAGVDVSIDLPGVGCNVQEHFYAGVSCELRDDIGDEYLTFDCLRDPEQRAIQKELYDSTGKGVFGMSTICMAFVSLASVSPAYEILETSLAESINARVASSQITPALGKQYQIQLDHIHNHEASCEFVLVPNFSSSPKPPTLGKQHITVSTMINNPFSRGTIHITSNDALTPPAIDPRYFDEEYDLLSFVEQIKFCRRILEQEPLKRLTEKEINPGEVVQTDEEIAAYIKSVATTTWHTIGSCSMLPLADGGVVDNKLKVYHTNNIRVVDVSIIPLHIAAHLQATAYAIGEIGKRVRLQAQAEIDEDEFQVRTS